jgi:hypothetical protein
MAFPAPKLFGGAIDYYAAHTLQAGNIDEYFGHFRGQPVDALGYVDSLRNDW